MRRLLFLALALSACDAMSPPPDAGPRLIVDEVGPPPPDMGRRPDAWSAPDGGPAVIPQQSWTISLALAPNADMSVTLEARAESGTVRGVVGGGGLARTVVFDVDGGMLVARDDVPIGITTRSLCDHSLFTFQQLALEFLDADGDGTHEALAHVRAAVVLVENGRGMAPTGATRGEELALAFAPDTVPPTITIDPLPFLPGLPLAVRASEPMMPTLGMQLRGAHTLPLVADVGASAAAAWRRPTWDLPAGHYDLAVTGEPSDLAGLSAATLPTLAIDLVDPTPLDALTPALSVRAATPLRLVGAMAGEVPFGAPDPTYLASGPFVMAFDVGAHGPSQISLVYRLSANQAAQVETDVVAFLPDGSIQAYQGLASFRASSSVSGYTQESDALSFVLPFFTTAVGRAYVAVFPSGFDAPVTCNTLGPSDVAFAFVRPQLS